MKLTTLSTRIVILSVALSALAQTSLDAADDIGRDELLHDRYRQDVAQALTVVAEGASIPVDRATFFLLTQKSASVAGMFLQNRDRITDAHFRLGVNLMLVLFSSSSDAESIPSGYYLLRAVITAKGESRVRLVGITNPGLSFDLASQFSPAQNCGKPPFEVGDGYICSNLCLCEIYTGVHTCGTLTTCFAWNP